MDNPNIMQILHETLTSTFEPAEQAALLEAYSLSGTPTTEQKYHGLMDLCSDLRFYLAVLKVAEGWPDKCYRYHVHQVS